MGNAGVEEIDAITFYEPRGMEQITFRKGAGVEVEDAWGKALLARSDFEQAEAPAVGNFNVDVAAGAEDDAATRRVVKKK
jgi:hypothetical protein